MAAASDQDGVMFSLSAGNCGDAPEGRALLRQLGPIDHPVHLLMNCAYEGDETRALAVELGYILAKDNIQLVIAGKNSAKSLQAAKKPLDLIALVVLCLLCPYG